MKIGWITGDALFTVLALRGLKKGDEVMLKPCSPKCATLEHGCNRIFHAGHATQDMFARSGPFAVDAWNPPLYPGAGKWMVRRSDDMGTVVDEQNIVAVRWEI